MSKLLAQGVDLETAIKINPSQSVGEVFNSPTALINIIVPNLFIFSGILLLFFIIGGGFKIVSSGSAEGVSKGKDQITWAIVGFIVMFAAYWIIQIVEFVTGIKILNTTL